MNGPAGRNLLHIEFAFRERIVDGMTAEASARAGQVGGYISPACRVVRDDSQVSAVNDAIRKYSINGNPQSPGALTSPPQKWPWNLMRSFRVMVLVCRA